jgi:hypothetical protein
MDELNIAYISSHDVVKGDEFAKFEPDGHFRSEYDREIASLLSVLIHAEYPELGTPGKRVIDEISLLQPEAVQGHGALNSGLSHNGALQSKLEAQYSEKSPAEFLDHAAGGS